MPGGNHRPALTGAPDARSGHTRSALIGISGLTTPPGQETTFPVDQVLQVRVGCPRRLFSRYPIFVALLGLAGNLDWAAISWVTFIAAGGVGSFHGCARSGN